MTTEDFEPQGTSPGMPQWPSSNLPESGDPTTPIVPETPSVWSAPSSASTPDASTPDTPTTLGDPTVPLSVPSYGAPAADATSQWATPLPGGDGAIPPVGPPSDNSGEGSAGGPPPKKRNIGKLLGLGVGVIGLVAGGAFAFTQITGGEKANTPEEAIESFYKSLETGDAIGMAKVLAPGERDIMLDSMVPMAAELSRLEILDKNLDLNKVEGYSAKVSNFKATSKTIRADLAEVRVTGGNLQGTIDPKKLPIGAFLRDLIGDELDKAEVTTTDEALRVGDKDDPLIMQKVGKRWYLSLNYTVAEAARRGSGNSFAVPPIGGGVPAKGADSPEAAVSEMMTAAGHFDVRRAIELLPPDEFAALHDYAGQFIGDAEEAVVEARKVAKIEITSKLRSTKISDDRVLVSIIDLPTTLKIDSDGTVVEAKYANKALSGQLTADTGEVVKADFKGDCLTLVVDEETKKGCGQKGIADLFSELSGQEIDTTDLSAGGLDYGQKCVTSKKRPELGMVTVKRNGKWFISPTRTMLDSMTALMKTLDRKDMDCIKNEIEKSVNSFQGTFLPSASDSTFDAPLDSDSDPFATDDSTSLDTEAAFDTLPSDPALGDSQFASPELTTKPVVEVRDGPPPAELEINDLVDGTGELVETGDTVLVQYVGVSWSTKKEFDSSWDRGAEPFEVFDVGNASVIDGWNEGLIGMRVGGRREIVIPPALGYGEQGAGDDIKPNETLVFVVDAVRVVKGGTSSDTLPPINTRTDDTAADDGLSFDTAVPAS